MNHDKLYSLFEKNVRASSTTCNQALVGSSSGVGGFDDDFGDESQEFDVFESQHGDVNRKKSQLDLYLEEPPRIDRKQHPNWDVLNFWKVNCVLYQELSFVARDILSIPITTIASELACSIGGRIIDKYRNSLVPRNAEALVCTHDWLYGYIKS
ncbi:hypothetical protein L1049_012270 [Liquidambar formosana]|uniref:HAT C-terminal dimerisation domain-containing protein n=1 Tax=Liquidambar formosana TaxID=63359 RepID=A0AAP0RXU8_LIQFO